jgi:hypothetical protein
MRNILKSYLKRLTNLSGTNRSLLMLRLSAEQDLDIHDLGFLNNDPSFTLIENLLAYKNEITLCGVLDSRNSKVNEISKKLKKIERREKFIFEERGAKDLYVGWPFVRGKFSDDTAVRCPLLFFPVTLDVTDKKWILKLREDVNISFNKSFLLAYSHFNQIPLSDEFLETSFEDIDPDSQVFRTHLYQLLKESPVEINFNQELFINKLQPFTNFKKADFDERNKEGELKLYPEAVLGIFPQAGSYLVPDYQVLMESVSFTDLEDFFYSRANIEEEDEIKNKQNYYISHVKEEHTFTPFKQDASQENALKAVKKGRSLVVQGPPGTGKSQLICNLIADFIARGKNVLLVCQKRAALDVVYKRLEEKEVGDFIGLVHDFKNDRKNIFSQINSQIEKLDEYKYKNNSLDGIYLERNFVQASRKIDQLTEELEEFKKALFDKNECGISVKELYLTCDLAKPGIDLKQEFKYFKSEEINSFVKFLKNYIPYAVKFERSDYIWHDRTSFNNFSSSDKKKLLNLLEHIPFFQVEVSEGIRELLGVSLDMEDFEWLLDRQQKIQELLHLLEDERTYSNFSYILNKNTDQDWLIIRERQITECFKESGIEDSLPSEQLGIFQKALEKAWQARRGLVKWIRWWLFSKDKFLLKRVFVSNKLESNKAGFQELIRKVDNRMNLEHNLTELKECGWLQEVPEERDLKLIQEWMHYQQTALGSKAILIELRSLKDYLNIPSLTYEELKNKLNQLVKLLNTVPQEKKKWFDYLTTRQVSKILEGFAYAIELSNVLREDFESLVEYDKMKQNLLSHEKAVLDKLFYKVKDIKEDEVIDLLQNSLRLEWIDFIENKYPVLRAVSSMKMEQIEKELRENILEKLKLSREILLMKVREQTYKNIEHNRVGNMVTYRELKHQVTKKKKIWPLRKVINSFNEELLQLIPCWMASPESVSAIFPMQQLFDIVIFDEASQCYIEKGIPAMYRGKQVVITGDSKQLGPSDLYQVRWEEDSEEFPELEIDSLLDLSRKYLMEVKLTGHYRSRSLELIEFSNHNFYNGNLRILPDRNDINNKDSSIKYIKVNGMWENNANRAEAEEVVRLIRILMEEGENNKSIGVVTFNYKQQNLIQDLLEEGVKAKIPDDLFVKNIENVQGDERDVIIFSVGYAPDIKGKFSMHFGSLNANKGENRLNVAVTRAKEKIIIVSSIMPQQLDISNAKHEGPKFFKKYLEYAWEVSKGNFRVKPEADVNYNPDWFLKKKIEKISEGLSYTVMEELPFADITVKTGEYYEGFIQTDDDIYHQSISAKNIHAYVPLNMAEKNWKYKKIFSRDFWENKEKVKEEIIRFFGAHV